MSLTSAIHVLLCGNTGRRGCPQQVRGMTVVDVVSASRQARRLKPGDRSDAESCMESA